MPFQKTQQSDLQQPVDPKKLFVGRAQQLEYFVRDILKPVDPSHNVLSIFGQGGIGKSTLLQRFLDEIHTPAFREYCLAALVNERQTTPASVMECFANQFRTQGYPLERFDVSLTRYKEVLRHMRLYGYQDQQWEDPIGDLTAAFVSDLNQLADTLVIIGSPGSKRPRRLLLFFDTFEQLAVDLAP